MARRSTFPQMTAMLAENKSAGAAYELSLVPAEEEKGEEFIDIDLNKEIEETLKIIPKQGGLTPFVPWPKQRDLNDVIRECRRNQVACDIIHLKCRQIGSTTDGEAVVFTLVRILPYRVAKVISHRKGAVARQLFQKLDIFYENLPADKKKPLKGSASGKPGQVNVDRLEYAAPHGSTILMETAGGRAGELGRSGTCQYQIWTEFDWWENQEENEAAANSTIPDRNVTWDTLRIVDSTANGQRGLKRLWDKAGEPNSGMIRFFTGIKDDPYAEDEIIPGRKCGTGARCYDAAAYEEAEQHGFVADALEEEYAKKYDVWPELLNWCRRIRENECFGSWDYFNQEHPVTPEVAWMFTGLPWYDQVKIAAWIELAEKEPPLFRGDVQWASSDTPRVEKAQEDRDGPLMIFALPIKGHIYVIGIDTGEGVGADYSSIVVWDITDMKSPEVVAHWRRNDRFGKPTWTGVKSFQLGAWYNWALLVPENNNPGPGTIAVLQMPPTSTIPQMKIPYPNLYYDIPGAYDDRNPEEKERAGWRTGSTSKGQMMNDFAELISHGNPKIRSLPLLYQLQEMRWVPPEKDKKGSKRGDWVCTYKDPRTRKAHDDDNMSAGLGWEGALLIENGRVARKQSVERESF